jgi:hypothetical protein
VKANAPVLFTSEYMKTHIIHPNNRAILMAKVLKTNSLEALSPLVKSLLINKVVIKKNNVGIQ